MGVLCLIPTKSPYHDRLFKETNKSGLEVPADKGSLEQSPNKMKKLLGVRQSNGLMLVKEYKVSVTENERSQEFNGTIVQCHNVHLRFTGATSRIYSVIPRMRKL